MLTIEFPEKEYFDDEKEEFFKMPAQKLQLEHSLISLDKWEKKWHIPFLSCENMTAEQSIDYIKCMTLNKNIDPMVYLRLTNKEFLQIRNYMNDPMTATTITDPPGTKKNTNSEVLTSELIYYYMFANQIPKECEKWHLNKLIMLLRVFGVKNSPAKRMSKKDIYAQQRALNAARRKKYHTKG